MSIIRFKSVLFPSLFIAFAAFVNIPSAFASSTTVQSTIASNTTWDTSYDVYIVNGTVTINSGVTLTIDPGVIVKFQSMSSEIQNNGIIDAQGTAGNEIYLTSYYDDYVGGDTDGGGASSGSSGDWGQIQTNSGATTTIANAVLRYSLYAFYNNGGILDISDSEVATNTLWSVKQSSGTSTIDTVHVHHNDTSNYGIYILGGLATVTGSTIHDVYYGISANASMALAHLTMTNSTFYNNNLAAVYISLSNGFTFTHSGNTATGSGSGARAIYLAGTLSADATLTSDDMPYAAYDITVPSGKTLTITEGAVLKFLSLKKISVAGTLTVEGTAIDPVYFTSIRDDASEVYGDTNGDSTPPATGDWYWIEFTNGTSDIANAVLRYGSYGYYNQGAVVDLASVEVLHTYYGLYHSSGTSTMSSSNIHDNDANGVQIGGGVAHVINNNSIHDHSSYGLYATAGTLELSDNYFYNDTVATYIGPSVIYSGSGNTVNPSGTVKGGYLATNETWTSANSPYIIAPWLVVPEGKTLTIQAGTVVKFMGATSSLYVVGTLDAQGTSGNEVIFTSIADDDADGNDTNNDGASIGSAGDWQTIFIDEGATATLTHAWIHYGGAYEDGVYVSLFNNGGTTDLDHVEIATSTNYGIYQSSGSMDILSSDILHTDSVGIGLGSGTLSVSGTRVRYNDYGIYLPGGTATIGSSVFNENSTADVYVTGGSSHMLNENAMYGYGAAHYGVYDSTAGSIDVTNNWWGSEGAPGLCSFGECSATTTSNLSHEPWHHTFGGWSVRDYVLLYHVTSTYADLISQAVSDWNSSATGMGVISVSSTSASTTGVLIIYDYEDSTESGKGQCGFTHIYPTASSVLDTIRLNSYCMDEHIEDKLGIDAVPSTQLLIVRHELGHALGLGHNPASINNVMWPHWDTAVTNSFGAEDRSDYGFLWGTIKWFTSFLWPQ